MRVFLNDRLVKDRHARISVFDHGFLYGDGIYETFRAYRGAIFRVDRHLDRLSRSAGLIHLRLPYPRTRLRAILYQTLKANRVADALLRVTVSRGEGEPGLDPDLCRRPTLVVTARPFRGYPERAYKKGITIAIVSVRRLESESQDPRIKSTSFLNNILAKIEAKKMGADEGLMLNREGYLTEGTVSNLFFVKRARLYTPSSRAGLLEGITRQAVLDLAKAAGLPFEEGLFSPVDLQDADEGFLTNTSMEIMPIVRVGKEAIGDGKPGPMTLQLRKAFRALVLQERG